MRLRVFCELLAKLEKHDFRSARTWIRTMYPGMPLPVRLIRFLGWALRMMLVEVPRTRQWVTFDKPVSRVPIWLAGDDPLDNYPFSRDSTAALPAEADTVVIGAGLIGAAAAYHWAKLEPARHLVVLEMNGVGSGSAGRNEGLVVMGRYYYYVHRTVLAHLQRTRRDLSAGEQDQLAHEFAASYVRAAYANAEMIAQTVAAECLDCDYRRKGWVQVPGEAGVPVLDESTRMARERGAEDWIKISAQQVFEHSGLTTSRPAGFSIGAATWNPVKWVRGLFQIALQSPSVQLFTRTRVTSVEDRGEQYAVHTNRGVILARNMINAAEAYSPTIFRGLHDIILPMQTQAAFGVSDGGTMKPGVGISSDRAFFGRHGKGAIFGSDATRVPDHEAGVNQPSWFITNFVLTEMKRQFAIQHLHLTNQWSGTVSYTPDEFPIVGLMDEKRLWLVGGMAGSGSGVSFNGARHIVQKILQIDAVDYYPEKYFSPSRFRPGWNARPQSSCPAAGAAKGA